MRACLDLSHEKAGKMVEISGQTCSSVETKKSEMTGNTFLSLVLFWGHNESAAVLPEHMDFLPSERLLGQNKGREWR